RPLGFPRGTKPEFREEAAMARVHALVGVAVCLLAVLIGCKTAEIGGVLAIDQAASNQTVNESLAVVALNTQQSLAKLKLQVEMSQDGQDAYFFTSKTANGARFRLALTRDKSGPTEK